MAESGVTGMDLTSWWAYHVPAGTPKPVIDQLNKWLNTILAMEDTKKFLNQFGLTFPNAPDPMGRVSVDYGVYGVPETYVIDQAGVIRLKHIGPVTRETVEKKIAPLVKELAK